MIKLEHLNLVVDDLDKTLAFYGAAFPNWRIRDRGDGEWYGRPRHWLHFGDDFTYIAFNSPLDTLGTGKNRDLTTLEVGLMHFAFEVDDLDALIDRMEKAGYRIKHNGNPVTYRKNVYFLDPDGFEVEFVEYLSDNPAKRNASE